MSSVLVSKIQPGRKGRVVLVSFAQVPLWKTYKELIIQEQNIPYCYSLHDMQYAMKKYANKEGFEIVAVSTIQKEINEFKNEKGSNTQ